METIKEKLMSNKHFAFTLAEVLITLGIIGVVAAVTMPVLINNIKYHSYDNAKRKVLNSIGEAGKLLAIEGDLNGAADAEDFVKNRLSKKLSIAKMCDSAHLTDCGLPSKFLKTDGKTEMDMPTVMKGGTSNSVFNNGSAETKAYSILSSYGFVTGNGYSINLFYNGACEPDYRNSNWHFSQNTVCVNVIYDMNGLRGPNIVGKDIGLLGVFYPNEETRAVAVLPADYDYSETKGGERKAVSFNEAGSLCDSFGSDYRMPDRNETSLMAINGNLLGILNGGYWSGTMGTTGAWKQDFRDGDIVMEATNKGRTIRCIRR